MLLSVGRHASGRTAERNTQISLGGYSLAFAPDGMPRGRDARVRTCWDRISEAVVKGQLLCRLKQVFYSTQLYHLFRLHVCCVLVGTRCGREQRRGGLASHLACDGDCLTARHQFRGVEGWRRGRVPMTHLWCVRTSFMVCDRDGRQQSILDRSGTD
jgi:hypothetical protein